VLDPSLLDWIAGTTGARRARPGERVQALWGGYGELVRVHLDSGPAPTVVLKHIQPPRRPPRDGGRGHARKLRSYAVEVAWYRDFADRCGPGCRVPRALASRSRGVETLLLLEDLDEAGFPERRRHLSGADCSAALTWLAHLHGTFLGVAPSGLWFEGSYWHLSTRPDERATMARGPLWRAAGALDRALCGARHRTLIHGDAKPANLCFGPGGVAAVDFQYVGGGCGMRDVAYLLSCLPSRWCETHASAALDHYFSVLRASLPATADGDAVEAEWRALLPVAWADFARFLAGWAPGQERLGPYGDAQVAAGLAAVDG